MPKRTRNEIDGHESAEDKLRLLVEERSVRSRVFSNALLTVFAVVAGLLSNLVTVAAVSDVLVRVVGVAAVSIFGGATALSSLLRTRREERETDTVMQIRKAVKQAYRTALDDSSLNPTRGGSPA